MKNHIYTAEERAFFQEYVPGHSYKEIQTAFTDRFGWEITIVQVGGCVKRYQLNTGRTGRFVKGHTSHNKGKKMSEEVYEKVRPTMFKKGNIPQNHREVGSTRITKDGYVEIKIAEPNKWCMLHRHKWQQINGPVPKGYCLIFKDNNQQNCEPDNLMLVTRNELKTMNKFGLGTAQGEYKEAAVSLAKAMNARSEAKQKLKKDGRSKKAT